MLSRIYLIRHGRTDGNRNHWYYGSTDLPLTEEGTEEIRAYAGQGIYPEIPEDADIYTTGLIRTDQTLEAIYGDLKHEALPKLQEINFGKAECMTYDDLKQFGNFDEWARDTTGNARIVDDAETGNEFHERIREGLKELIAKHRLKEWSHRHSGKDAVSVVVCHGGVIACIMETLFPAVCGSMWDWLPEPGFGYAVDFKDSDPYMYTRINDTGRLGLGIYRLPERSPGRIDHKKTEALIDSQMTRGCGYLELEFLGWRGGSGENRGITLRRLMKAIREALVKRYDRNRYYLTAMVDRSRLDELGEMLRLSGAGYFDRVSVAGTEALYGDYPERGELTPEVLADKRIDGPEDEPARPSGEDAEAVWEKVRRLKESGAVRKAGLTFSGSPSLFDDILKGRPEIDYVELPVNYRIGLSESDLAQKYYTIARRRYKEIIVRSPFDGGSLLSLSEEAGRILGIGEAPCESEDDRKLRRTMAGYAMLKKEGMPKTACDWALRYVLSYPFVVICIASTGDPEHAGENTEASERFRPLSEEDRDRLEKACKGESNE